MYIERLETARERFKGITDPEIHGLTLRVFAAMMAYSETRSEEFGRIFDAELFSEMANYVACALTAPSSASPEALVKWLHGLDSLDKINVGEVREVRALRDIHVQLHRMMNQRYGLVCALGLREFRGWMFEEAIRGVFEVSWGADVADSEDCDFIIRHGDLLLGFEVRHTFKELPSRSILRELPFKPIVVVKRMPSAKVVDEATQARICILPAETLYEANRMVLERPYLTDSLFVQMGQTSGVFTVQPREW